MNVGLAEIVHPAPKTGTAVEAAVLSRLREDGQHLLLKYLDDNTVDSTTYIGRDAAKLLFPEYRAAPTEHNRDCDLAASAIADAARRTIFLQEPQAAQNLVTILTGCPASGKTVNADGPQPATIEVVHETIFTDYERARQLIVETADAKRLPSIHLFYTDDPRINVKRMLLRAAKIGRTVPISYMASMYLLVPEIVARLEKEFAGTLTVRVTNNSETEQLAITHNQTNRALYHTQRYTLQSCLEAMHAELREANRRNDVSPAVLREAVR